MALCAGYTAAQPQDSGALVRAVEGYESEPDSENRVVGTKHGHHVFRCRTDAVNKPSIWEDDQGNSLMLLGFVRRPSGRALFDHVVHNGAASLEALEGQFVAVFCEAKSGTVHIVNDRFGSRPFYLLRNGGETYYSSALAFLFPLAGIRPDPDPIGWLEIFAYGHTLGQRTNRSGAVRLRPGSHVTVSTDNVDDRQYWKLGHEPEDLDVDAHADATFEAFVESARWRARRRPRCLIALSGGLDSRMVAAAVPSETNPLAFTLRASTGNTKDLEVETAAQVASSLDLSHEIWPLKIGSYSKLAAEVVKLTDGLVPMHHPAKTMHYLERLDSELGYLMGGGPGDSLAGAFVPAPEYLDPLRTVPLGTDFWARHEHGFQWPVVFSRDFVAEHGPSLRESFLDRWEALKGPTAAHRATAWAMSIRQPAFTFTSPIHNHPLFEEGAAHLGYRYSDLMLKLPAAWIYGKNFYKYMIYRCVPQLRDVAYANTGELLSGNLERFVPPRWHPYRDWLGEQARRPLALARPVRRVLGKLRRRRWKPEFDFSILSRDTALVNEVEASLDLPSFPAFFDGDLCRQFLQTFREGRLRISSVTDAEIFGCLATACYTAKQDGR